MKKFIAPLFAALALLFTVFTPSAALAHDELVSSYPEANSTVEAGTFAISVTFNEDAMQVDGNAGFGFVVTDPTGTEVPTACLSVNGAEVSTLVSIDNPGDYKVDWRSVSNDGHANSGTFNFTLTNTTSFVAESDINAACDASRTAIGGATPQAVVMAAPEASATPDTTGTTSSFGWIGLGIGAGLIAVGAVAGAIRARSKERKAAADPEILSDDK